MTSFFIGQNGILRFKVVFNIDAKFFFGQIADMAQEKTQKDNQSPRNFLRVLIFAGDSTMIKDLAILYYSYT